MHEHQHEWLSTTTCACMLACHATAIQLLQLLPEPGLGHAYYIAFYALKKKAKIRELNTPGFKCGFNCGPPSADLSFVPAHFLSVTLLSVSKLREMEV